jgi:hypothetical protein
LGGPFFRRVAVTNHKFPVNRCQGDNSERWGEGQLRMRQWILWIVKKNCLKYKPDKKSCRVRGSYLS